MGWVISKHALSKLNKLLAVAEQKGAEGGLGAPRGPCARRWGEDMKRWKHVKHPCSSGSQPHAR